MCASGFTCVQLGSHVCIWDHMCSSMITCVQLGSNVCHTMPTFSAVWVIKPSALWRLGKGSTNWGPPPTSLCSLDLKKIFCFRDGVVTCLSGQSLLGTFRTTILAIWSTRQKQVHTQAIINSHPCSVNLRLVGLMCCYLGNKKNNLCSQKYSPRSNRKIPFATIIFFSSWIKPLSETCWKLCFSQFSSTYGDHGA